jgi:hypothetical protein
VVRRRSLSRAVTPALNRSNLAGLAAALTELGARQYEEEPFGRWETQPDGEQRWVLFEPTAADRAARAAWAPDPEDPSSFDHLLWTRYGTLDVVPAIADQLATLTVPRRSKDVERVRALRALERG